MIASPQRRGLTAPEPGRRPADAFLREIADSIVSAGIATGENLTGLEQYRPLRAADAIDIVQCNASWGITHALRAATLAHGINLPVSRVGLKAVTALAVTAISNHLTSEVQDLGKPIGVAIDQRIEDGGIVLGDEPGSGVVLDKAAIARLSLTNVWTRTTGPHVRPARASLRLVPEDPSPAAPTLEARG